MDSKKSERLFKKNITLGGNIMNRKVNLGIVLLISALVLIVSSCNSNGYGKSSRKNCGCPSHRGIVG
jgi:hypothetical protein